MIIFESGVNRIAVIEDVRSNMVFLDKSITVSPVAKSTLYREGRLLRLHRGHRKYKLVHVRRI